MVLKSICLIRHGSRAGYKDAIIQGTNIPALDTPLPGKQQIQKCRSDDPLTMLGQQQAQELAAYLAQTHPEIGAVYTSRHYRCFQTVKPYIDFFQHEGKQMKLRFEPGLSEWQRVDRKCARPPNPSQLKQYFLTIDLDYQPLCFPLGHENLDEFYARNAYFLTRLIQQLDNDGDAPESEKDFMVPAIGFYKFIRQNEYPLTIDTTRMTELGYPVIDWEDNTALGGSWTCALTADCSFLSSGPIMIWGPSDIPEPLPPSEALKMPKPTLPNFFDIQEENERVLISINKVLENKDTVTVTALEVLVEPLAL
ncbi:hypothetical protein ABW20_dc0102347 [Dactylellina cionopaga]|nr:hypothetical protein ABW20_dc0102347 [Dactylellina cionopaga]